MNRLGSLLSIVHVAFQAMTAPIRNRRQLAAIQCLMAVSDAKDAFRQAKVRGDTRRQHEAADRLKAATTDLLRAEQRMGWRV